MTQDKAIQTTKAEQKPYKISKRQNRRLIRFLEAYKATGGRVVDSCKIASIDPSTYYNWFENLPDFKMQLIEQEQDIFDDAYSTIVKKSKTDINASKYILKRDKRFKEDKVQDNRKITINYPNWA